MYDHILKAFYGSPWAIDPDKLSAIEAFLWAKARGEAIDPAAVEIVAASRRPDGVQMAGKVAILPVFGVISQRVGMLERASGGVSTEEIGAALDGLAADRSIRSIVLAFDSPGGSVFGVQELADKIRGLRSEKRIVGIADSVAASAAYWLLSQCSEVNCTPGGQVGSIGVLAAHTDESKREEAKGRKTTIVSAGEFKTEGNPYGPLTEEARAEMQAKVDHYYGQFLRAVATGRGTTEARVKADMGQGRMVTAQDAVRQGMADRVATMEQVLRRLGAGDAAGPAAQAMERPLSAQLAAIRARAVEVQE